MKAIKQCGYLDQKGNFHKSLHKCNNENIWMEMQKIRNQINRLIMNYSQTVAKDFNEQSLKRYGFSGMLNKILSQLFTYRHKELVTLGYDIKRLQNEWDKLEKLSGTPRFLRKEWWTGSKIEFKKRE